MKFSERIEKVTPSVTLEITAKAKELKAKGEDILPFAAGETEVAAPDSIQEKAIEAIRKGNSKYLPAAGLKELRESIVLKYEKAQGLGYSLKNTIVSSGAKHVLYNAMQVLLNPGDEVLIPAPYWLSYPQQANLAEANPIIVPTREEDHFQLNHKLLAERTTPKTKLLILNSPSNPSGAIYTKETIEEVAGWLRENPEVCVIFDEIYEKLIYDGQEHQNLLHFAPDLKDRCLLVNGLSKSHAITGWRIGYGVGPEDWIAKMNTLQSHSTSNATSVIQLAVVEAVQEGDSPYFKELVATYQERRDVMWEGLNAIPEVKCIKPQGAFYTFPNFGPFLKKKFKGETVGNMVQLAKLLLENAKIACVPGDPFGAPENMRMSYTLPCEQIKEGIKRLETFLSQLEES